MRGGPIVLRLSYSRDLKTGTSTGQGSWGHPATALGWESCRLDIDMLRSLSNRGLGLWKAQCLVALPSVARTEAHYLWVTVETKSSEPMDRRLLSLQ